jgi:alpha-tubulin suppressor-like RCC1 family protein
LGLAVDMYAMQNIPEPLDSSDELANRRVARVSAGSNHAACIAAGSGELFYWGMGLHLEPVRVDALLHTKIVDVACGREYTIAVDEDGRAYSWGKGKAGCLGQGGSIRQLHRPARMEAFGDDQSVVQVSAGWTHAACLVAKNSS